MGAMEPLYGRSEDSAADEEGGEAVASAMSDEHQEDGRKKLSFEASMPVEEVAAYLEALVVALRKRSVTLRGAEAALTLTPAPHVELEVGARQKRDKERLSIEISWRAASELGLTVSSDEL